MARIRPGTTALNAGEFGGVMAAHIDFAKYNFAAKTMINWLPLVQGGISRRQGFRILETLNATQAYHPFKSNRDNAYLVAASDSPSRLLRFWYDDQKVVTKEQVTITNPTLTGPSPPTGWTDVSTGGASVTGGTFTVPAASTGKAAIEQSLTTVASTRYSVFVNITLGAVTIKLGSATGTSELGQHFLRKGFHNLEFTASGATTVLTVESEEKSGTIVVAFGSQPVGSELTVAHGYTLDQARAIQYTQSVDVQFLATGTHPLSSLSRRGIDGFGWQEEQLINGPYADFNTSSITLLAGAVSGSVTIAASAALFSPQDVGRLVYIENTGQREEASITSEGNFTDEILVDGSGSFRVITVTATGGTGGTIVTLQRSFNAPGAWQDVGPYTGVTTYDDTLDNQVVYYRIGVKTGDYASGTVTAVVQLNSGTVSGEALITAYVSPLFVTAAVQNDFGFAGLPTTTWRFGRYGGSLGYPSSVQLHEGRLWLGNNQYVDGSVSDDFTNFDTSSTDDDRSISRLVDSPVSWMQSIGELVVGTSGEEYYGQSQLNKVYTPADFRLKKFTQEGSREIAAVVSDLSALFVHKDKTRLMEVAVAEEVEGVGTRSMARLHPKIGQGGIKKIRLQKSPEIRIWCLKDNGQLIVLTYLRDEDVLGWSRIHIAGEVVDFEIVEGRDRDRIYAEIVRQGGTRVLCIYDDETWTIPSGCNNLDFSFTPVKPDPGAHEVYITGGTFSRETGYSGEMLLTATGSAFVPLDIGKRVYLKDGQGIIQSNPIGFPTTARVLFDVPISDQDPVAAGEWFMGSTTTSLTGLNANEEVYVYADAVEYGPLTTDGSGNLTIPTAAGWVHVGQRPRAIFESLKMHLGARSGIGISGVNKKISEIGLTVDRTADVLDIGALSCSPDDLEKVVIDQINAIGDIGVAGAVYTGEARAKVEGMTEFDPRVRIVAERTGPATILSYAPTYSMNER